MTDDPTIPEGSLPAGEASEERLWTCVGHALTCWEHMESELAWLYTIFVDRPGNLGTLADYGDENGTFSKRLRCVLRESMNYFRKRPDQADEGEFSAIFHQATELSIVRHRIAHGITRPVLATREIKVGWNAPDSYVYFLGAPWYAVQSLRTPWIGTNADGINRSARQFLELANRITLLNGKLHSERPQEHSE